MEISYDIFELTDFPVIVTDGALKIKYKNSVATTFMPKFRKGSKISKYAVHPETFLGVSDTNKIEFATGTQYTRAVVSSCDMNDTFVFLFLPRLQFDSYDDFIRRIDEKYSGDFVKFYVSSFREYIESQQNGFFKKARKIPERTGGDLIYLIKSSVLNPNFMKKDIIDLSCIIKAVSKRISRSLRTFGLRFSQDEFSKNAEQFCICKINPNDLSFVLLRMIYMAFKLSANGRVSISLDYNGQTDKADICVYTDTFITDFPKSAFVNEKIKEYTPELSFEYKILEELYTANNFISFETEKSVLKIDFTLPCVPYSELLVLKSPTLSSQNSTHTRILTFFIARTKKLIQSNISSKNNK